MLGARKTIRMGGSEKQASLIRSFSSQESWASGSFERLLYLLPGDKKAREHG